jgi:hypothetical protein
MSPSRLRALLVILQAAIRTVILAHTTQRRAPLPRAQRHTQTTALNLGAAVHQDMSAVTPPERAFPGLPSTAPTSTGTREGQAAPPVAESRHAELHTRMEAVGTPPQLMMGAASLHASGMVAQCSARRAYQLAWSSTNGPLPCVEILMNALRDAEQEGLRPPSAHLASHVSRDADIPDAGTRASRLSGTSERLTCTLHEMSADDDAQPV